LPGGCDNATTLAISGILILFTERDMATAFELFRPRPSNQQLKLLRPVHRCRRARLEGDA
jgi:hypothetical protein